MKYLNFANPVSGNGKPEFLMTLIDLSPSMDEADWKPSRREGAIKANIELIELKAKYHPQDTVGVIGFGSHAKLLHRSVKIGDNSKSVRDSLKKTPSPSGTNFTAALQMAEDCLFGKNNPVISNCFKKSLKRTLAELFYEPNPRDIRTIKGNCAVDGITRRIVMLTDGEHNGSESPQPVADRLKNAGVVIDCIGIGGTPTDVDEQLLNTIASRNSDGTIRYCFIGDQQALIRKYETLARHIRPV